MLKGPARRMAFGVLGAMLMAVACGSEADENPYRPRTRVAVDAGSGDDEGINATGVGAGTGANTGLPCDVQHLLENRCIGCHLAGSSVPLLTYDDLSKPSVADPTESVARRSLERMKDPANPMPPKPAEPPSAAEVQTMQAWVDAKTPKGSACTDAAPDAGVATSIYDTPTVCTSQRTWTGGNDESPNMRPGGACITCHSMKGGPAYKIAGTVYPTAHEPNDCNGASQGLTVIVTDAQGVVTNVPVNSVGNFYSRASLTPPFKVKVSDGNKERVMAGALTAGDCNTCHTEKGVNGAPGRVMAP